MCRKDTWYEFNEGGCLNVVAHIVLCGFVMVMGALCVIKGMIVLPHLVPRAKRILCVYIATQTSVILVEIFGLILLKTDSTALSILRWFWFSTFAVFQYWGTTLRTAFFLETIASTQQYKAGQWITIIRVYLVVLLFAYTIISYLVLVIFSGTLKSDTVIQAGMGIGSLFYFAAFPPTALVGYRLLAVIRTVIELGHTQPARVAIARENMMTLRQGMMKTIVSIWMAVVLLLLAAVIRMHWVIVHCFLMATQVGFVGAVAYLETCRIDRARPSTKHMPTHNKDDKPGHIGHEKPGPEKSGQEKSGQEKSGEEKSGGHTHKGSSSMGEDIIRVAGSSVRRDLVNLSIGTDNTNTTTANALHHQSQSISSEKQHTGVGVVVMMEKDSNCGGE